MYDGAEGVHVELKVMLAVVVLMGLIGVGTAFTDGKGKRDAVDTLVAADAPEEVPPETAPTLPQHADSTAGARDSILLVVEAPRPEPEAVEPPDDDEEAPPPPSPPAPPPPDAVVPDVIDDAVIAAQLSRQVHFEERAVAPPPSPPRSTPPAPPPTTPEPPPPAQAEFFEAVEQMPELQGGLAGLQRRITYPERAHAAGVEGRVFVQFVVDERGRPHDVHVVRGIGAGCDEAAVQAVRASRFTPGLQRGRPVKVRMTLPVTFQLGD